MYRPTVDNIDVLHLCMRCLLRSSKDCVMKTKFVLKEWLVQTRIKLKCKSRKRTINNYYSVKMYE